MIFYISILIYFAKSQLQVNPISGERFFYGGRQLNYFEQGLNISQPDLGFQVQGGLIQGPQNTVISASNILSVSLLEQNNTLAILESGNNQYQISLIQYYYNGTIDEQQILFNISSDGAVCQQIEIIDYLTIIVHCINTTNNNVILYNYNQSQTIITLTQIYVNQTQLISVEIQEYDNLQSYRIYLIYILQKQSLVYYCYLENNTYSQYQQVWSYNAQFLQVYITQFEEIFALQFNYLLYQYSSYLTTYAFQNNSYWQNMLVLEFIEYNLVYLINNYTLSVLTISSQFILIQQVQLPFTISNGQIFSNSGYMYVITNQFVLTYTYPDQENYLQLYQYNQYVLTNLTLYNRQQNILININTNGIQLYQLLDYYIYNNKPTQSGNITLNYYNQITQQITSSFQIYINTQKTFSNQICPKFYNFSGLQYILSGNNQYYTRLSYFEGYNMSYYNSMQDYNGLYQVVQTDNIFNNTIGTSLAVYSLTNYNSFLVVFQESPKVVFEIYQYLDQAYSSVVKSDYTLNSDLINEFQFIEYPNGTLLVLAFQNSQIIVFQYEAYWQVQYKYTVNMTNYMKTNSINIDFFFSNGGTAFFASFQYYYIINFGVDNFTFYQNGTFSYAFVSNLKFDRNYIFASQSNYVATFIWQDESLIPINTWQVPGVNTDQLNLYVFPLVNGTYVIYGTVKDMTLVFYDKSMFKTANFGNVFNMSVNVTGYTFSTYSNNYFYSSNYFYAVVQYNGLVYLNIYQCTQSPINALYKSIWLEATPVTTSVTTNTILGVDYVILDIKSTNYIYQIPHNVEIIIFPQFQLLSQYNFNNQIIVNNSYSQTTFNMSFTVEQPFLYISNQNSNINISNNITNYSFALNPFYFFTGAIEGYQVSCQECQEISSNQLISQQSLQLGQGTQYSQTYSQNGLQYLFIGFNQQIIQYIYNQSQQYNLTNYNSTGQTLVSYSLASQQLIYNLFLEIYTNSISWVSQNKTTAFVNSILQGTNQSISIQIENITTNIQFVCYFKGVLQITTENYYFSYYYYIQNQTSYLVAIIENLQISPSSYMQITPILTFYNKTNLIYGIFYQTLAYTIQLLLLDVTFQNIPIVNGINDMPLFELLKLQQLSPIQSISQIGSPSWDGYYQTINIVYTTSLKSGSLSLLFDRLRLIYLQEMCQFYLLNSSYQLSFNNLIASNGNLMATLNIQQGRGQYQLILSLYYYSEESCVNGQTLQPYSYQLLESNNSLFPQLNFLNSHQLLISYNDMTYLYEVNKYLQINYVTDVNSTIVLSAFNSISSSNQSIDVYFTPPNNTTPNNTTPNNTTPNNTTPNNTTPNNTTPNNTTPNNTKPNNQDNKSTHLQWYWILLITIGTLFIVVIIIVGIYLKFYRNQNEDGKYKHYNDNEIEIKASSILKLNQ